MENSIEIIKTLLIPKLETDKNFKNIVFKTNFWEIFLSVFLNFEKDAKPTYALIYELQLNDAEKIFEKLPDVYSKLIKDLAELYVLDIKNKVILFLLENNNSAFQKEVVFLKTLKNVIKKTERKRIKAELPNAYERLTFELSESKIEATAKKIGRQNLKEKFKNWDIELEVEKPKTVFYSLTQDKKSNPKSKVISVSWTKYAVAACLVLGIGLWFFKFSNPELLPNDTNVVTTKEKDTILKTIPKINDESLEAIVYSINTNENKVQYPAEFGFTDNSGSKSISVIIKDGSKSIKELESISKNEPSNNSRKKAIEEQLNTLNSKIGKYEFDAKSLTIYTVDLQLKTAILSIDNKDYFLKRNDTYYYLYFTKLPLKFKEIKDEQLIEQLEKISFENE